MQIPTRSIELNAGDPLPNVGVPSKRPAGPVAPGDLVHRDSPLLAAGLQMASRLRDHIERLDDGAAHAIDDIAVVLRALLCDGKGNRVLARLYDSTGIARPSIRLSAPPSKEKGVVFSVGSIPTDEPGAAADGAIEVNYSRWPATPLLTVAYNGKVTYLTWSQFLSEYANKWGGAHIDELVPATLALVDRVTAGGLSLSGYLLRTAGIKVWWLLQDIFRKQFGGFVDASQALIDSALWQSPGGVETVPRDRSQLGALQSFTYSKDAAHVVWYVHDTSRDGYLRIFLGDVPQVIRDTSVGTQAMATIIPFGDAPVQAPRKFRTPTIPTSDATALGGVPFSMVQRTLAQVRSAGQDGIRRPNDS